MTDIDNKVTIAKAQYTDEELEKLISRANITSNQRNTIMLGSVDNNVNQICDEFIERSLHGYNKYGVTTERNDLDLDQWLQHLKEEMMDAVVYLHRIQRERALDKMVQQNEQLDLYDDEPKEGC